MTEEQIKKRRRIVLFYVYCLWVLWVVYCVLTETPVKTESGMRLASCAFVALAVGVNLGFMWFCTLDARLVGKPLPQLARIGIFLGWPVGVPIYLVWARRLRGVGLLLLHAAGLLLTSVIAILVTWYLRDGSLAFG